MRITIFVICLCLAACATNKTEVKSTPKANEISKKEISFFENYGLVKLEFDDKGQEWISLQSTGTAPLTSNNTNTREEAFMLAGMRAQRNLLEFLKTTLDSSKSTESISKVILEESKSSGLSENKKDNSIPDEFGDPTISLKQLNTESNEKQSRANNVAQRVKETISQSANGIIKGAMIVERKVDPSGNGVAITLRVTRNTIEAAKNIKIQMESMQK